jgi:lipid A 3-O-deacylase
MSEISHSIMKISEKYALIAILALFSGSALAQHVQGAGVSARAGIGEHYSRTELAWESPTLWSHELSGDWGRLDLVAEAGAAYWHSTGSRQRVSVWQFSLVPMLRWHFADNYYAEAGIGPSIFTHATIAGEEISSAFQFSNHIGVGAYLSDHSRIGARFSHFSNGGLKRPNPGLNVVQILYTYQF